MERIGPAILTDEYRCCQFKYDPKVVVPQEILEEVRVYVHSPCRLNICNGYNLPILKEMVRKYERNIVHCGNNSKDNKLTIINSAKNINKVKIPAGHYVYIENAAGQGKDLGDTWNEFRQLYEAIDQSVVKVCVDTQHSFASELCDFRRRRDIRKLFETAEDEIGGIQLIHLNDSKKEFGSRIDRHECIGQGYIWKDSQKGLKTLIRRATAHDTDIILETPDPIGDIDYLRDILV